MRNRLTALSVLLTTLSGCVSVSPVTFQTPYTHPKHPERVYVSGFAIHF